MDVLPFDPAQPAREASNEPRLTGPYPPYRVIGSGNDAGELRRETHLYGPDVWLPRGAQLGCIKTYWGTMVFADVERGTLRHGPEESSPRNLVISDDRDTTYLFYLTPDGNRCTLRLRPSGEGVGRGSATDQPVGRPQAFRAVQTLVDGQIKFGLWSVGFFLSAEEDGRITLSRRALGPWEQFRFMDPADEAEDVSQSVTNVALDKPALQSSISEWSLGRTIEADACIATNGDITSNIFFHTDHEVSPWWQVDLQEEFIIESIRIFNRRDIPERLKHFTVLTSLTGETGDWLKLYRKDTDIIFGRDDDPFVIIPDTQWIARFVRIRLDQVGFLHLRECEVLGRRPAFDDLSRFRAQTRELQQRAIEEEARHTRELVNGRIGCITKIDSYSVFVDTDKYSSVLVTELMTGGYEALERQVVKATVRPDDRVLELGTAVGVVTMTIASIVGPTNVITYDANPVIIADARRNFAANGYGEISANVGVMRNRSCWSPVEAETDFFIARDFWASRLHATADSCDIASVVRVPLVCLEDVIEEHRANVLVCDIEGAEAELLLGADLSPIQMIVMETHYWACGRRKIDEMIRFLIMSGFEINLDHTASHIVVFDRNK